MGTLAIASRLWPSSLTKTSPCSMRRWVTRCRAKGGRVCLRLLGSRPKNMDSLGIRGAGRGHRGARGVRRCSGSAACPWAALQRTGCRDSGWGQLGLWLLGPAPAAGLRNIRGPRGVRAPLAGVAGWCSSSRCRSLQGETVAGQGGAASWNLIYSPVMRPRPFRMVAEEARAAWAAFGLVQPQLPYPHLSLEQSAREMA